MLPTRIYLGMLPLQLQFIAVAGVTTLLYRSLARSLEHTLVVNYRAMISGYEMREAANFMTGALVTAQRGDLVAARDH